MSEVVLTAEQKLRMIITGHPYVEPNFKHEGEDVVRWLTGGTQPDAYVTFHNLDGQVEVRCVCGTVLGSLPVDLERVETAKAIERIRLSGHDLHKPADGFPPRSQIV